MSVRLNPNWVAEQCARMQDSVRDHEVYEVTVTFTLAAQQIIFDFNKRKIPFKVINLGAGVRKITTDVDICPKCHGTGRC